MVGVTGHVSVVQCCFVQRVEQNASLECCVHDMEKKTSKYRTYRNTLETCNSHHRSIVDCIVRSPHVRRRSTTVAVQSAPQACFCSVH
jgi:hypothetical protein